MCISRQHRRHGSIKSNGGSLNSPSEVLQAAEHALDGVAVAIEEWREAVLPLPICLWRDVWHRATPLDLLTDRISVVALVGVQDVAARKPFEQRLSSGAVCYLSASEPEGKRATLSVCQRVDFRRAAAARTADGLIFLPPFPPAAERCALTAELSIRTCAGGPPA